MATNETFEKLAELTARIKELPKGYISKKTIGGKIYYYHQWSESGSKQSRYIKDDEVEPLAKLIDERKELQTQVSALKKASTKKTNGLIFHTYHTRLFGTKKHLTRYVKTLWMKIRS